MFVGTDMVQSMLEIRGYGAESVLSFHHVDSGISLGSSGLGKAPLPAEPSHQPPSLAPSQC